ncbi:MAG: NAD(P)H-dependent oxidoreductase subunit E [Planctomycetota bacterium]|nr:NAD(P)H-dependent oxidoreductase subunit E [Planctomycetota bacterium]
MAFTFTDDSRRQLEWLLTRYPEKRAALLPAMRLVEEQQGCVDVEALDCLARELGLPPAYVYGVFTFYTHYRLPTDGKYVVMVCATLPCALRGAQMVFDTFKEELKIGLGETTPDKMFTLKKVECLGSCTTAPVCQINDDFFENLTPQKIREIVEDLKAGRVPRHLSNGPTLDGGKCGYRPMVEAMQDTP